MTKRALCAAAVLMMALASAAEAALHQQGQAPAAPRPPAAPPVQAPPAVRLIAIDDRSARDTRDRLKGVLDQYPPTVREVLRLDPSLLTRPEYLAAYPGLAAFLEQHPEVAHNPAYFVGDTSGAFRGDQPPPDSKIEAIRAWRGFMEFLPVVAIVFIITSALAGLIRTLIDQRRWQRAARMQMDMQNKLIDRFSGSDELLAYMQSPTGRGLMDLPASPAGLSMAPRNPLMSMMPPLSDAPLGRIFWSLQAGIVLAAAGAGLLLVGSRVTFDELSQPISGGGILALAVGIGFIVSAGASYLISHRLGLVPSSARPDFGRETPGP